MTLEIFTPYQKELNTDFVSHPSRLYDKCDTIRLAQEHLDLDGFTQSKIDYDDVTDDISDEMIRELAHRLEAKNIHVKRR